MKLAQLELLRSGTHCGFCDESKYNIGRFRAISLVSMRTQFFSEYYGNLQHILTESNVFELKWHELSSAKMRFAVIKALDYTLDCADCGKIRVDTLIWDIEDSRHKVLRRDDLQNIQRMYFHLLNNVIIRRYGELGYWIVFPDMSGLNWEESEKVMQNQISKMEDQKRDGDPFGIDKMGFLKISQTNSHECIPIQIADIFAGLASHSRQEFIKHLSYYSAKRGRRCKILYRQNLSNSEDIIKSLSRSDRERCLVLNHLFSQCRIKKWEIHLMRSHGLKTSDPSCPINFWHYTPQSDKDKAPVKEECRR